jgi:hypothetical protein
VTTRPRPPLARTLTTAAAVALLSAAAAPALASTTPASTTPASTTSAPTGVLRTWTAANEAPPSVDLAGAVATARQHDVITALPGTYRAYVAQMREANPDLRLYAYLNGSYAQQSQGSAYPEAGTRATRPATRSGRTGTATTS